MFVLTGWRNPTFIYFYRNSPVKLVGACCDVNHTFKYILTFDWVKPFVFCNHIAISIIIERVNYGNLLGLMSWIINCDIRWSNGWIFAGYKDLKQDWDFGRTRIIKKSRCRHIMNDTTHRGFHRACTRKQTAKDNRRNKKYRPN